MVRYYAQHDSQPHSDTTYVNEHKIVSSELTDRVNGQTCVEREVRVCNERCVIVRRDVHWHPGGAPREGEDDLDAVGGGHLWSLSEGKDSSPLRLD